MVPLVPFVHMRNIRAISLQANRKSQCGTTMESLFEPIHTKIIKFNHYKLGERDKFSHKSKTTGINFIS